MFILFREVRLQLINTIKMISDDIFVSPSDEDEFFNPGSPSFFKSMLN